MKSSKGLTSRDNNWIILWYCLFIRCLRLWFRVRMILQPKHIIYFMISSVPARRGRHTSPELETSRGGKISLDEIFSVIHCKCTLSGILDIALQSTFKLELVVASLRKSSSREGHLPGHHSYSDSPALTASLSESAVQISSEIQYSPAVRTVSSGER